MLVGHFDEFRRKTQRHWQAAFVTSRCGLYAEITKTVSRSPNIKSLLAEPQSRTDTGFCLKEWLPLSLHSFWLFL